MCPALQDGLGKNSTLERLELNNVKLAEAGATNFSFHFAVIKAARPNKTQKTLFLHHYGSSEMTDDEVRNLTSLLKQNYGLENLPGLESGERMGDLCSVLQLNGVGRGYLHDDGSSVMKCVDVLSAVRDDLNCVFLHLLENPSLCNRDSN
jgi:hypothetical protein